MAEFIVLTTETIFGIDEEGKEFCRVIVTIPSENERIHIGEMTSNDALRLLNHWLKSTYDVEVESFQGLALEIARLAKEDGPFTLFHEN